MRKKRKSKNKNEALLIIPAVVLVGVLLLFGQLVISENKEQETTVPQSDTTVIVPNSNVYHIHADFKVFLNGEEVNFNKPKFSEVDKFVHLHISNPQGDKIIHVHARDVPIGAFFGTFGMDFGSECFVLDNNESFCNEGEKRLKLFVNGEENPTFGDYVIQDLDRILVTYGSSEDEIKEQIESVTDFACISSGQCPDRQAEIILPEDSPGL